MLVPGLYRPHKGILHCQPWPPMEHPCKSRLPTKVYQYTERIPHWDVCSCYSCGLLSGPFEVRVGVKQGCVLAPLLFNIYLADVTLLCYNLIRQVDDITYRYRLDDSFLNLCRLQAQTKTWTDFISSLQCWWCATYFSFGRRPPTSSGCWSWYFYKGGGRWICKSRKWRTKKDQRLKNAGPENAGPTNVGKCKTWIRRTKPQVLENAGLGKCRTKSHGWKKQDLKMADLEITDVYRQWKWQVQFRWPHV